MHTFLVDTGAGVLATLVSAAIIAIIASIRGLFRSVGELAGVVSTLQKEHSETQTRLLELEAAARGWPLPTPPQWNGRQLCVS